MKYPFIVFDLDGTLVDSLPDIAAAVNGALAEIGAAPLPLGQIRDMVGDGSPALMRRALAASGIAADRHADRLARFVALYDAAPVARTVAYPGVRETLAALAAEGRRMGVCTNKLQGTTLGVLRGLGLDGYFAAVLGGDMVAARKPDPGHLLAVLMALGGGPDGAVMIGDGENDIAAARSAGARSIL
ncbi:MAG: cbbZ1, partial [Rhodospirillales bacterium]|nr:cbbZ1 [Rhodospirillales bacterium]